MRMGMMLGGRQIQKYAASLASNGTQFVLSSYAATAGWNLNQPVEITLTVQSNVERQSTSVAEAGMHLNGLQSGSLVNVINNGYLIGRGGIGGDAGGGEDAFGGIGGPGLWLVSTGVLLRITNASGYIWGGGGGGGASSTGGGGGGAGGGLAGAGSTGDDGFAGTTGRFGTYGAGGSGAGRGGAYGEAGVANMTRPGGVAGNSVKYAVGSTLTWVSGASRILGPVGT